MSKDWTPGELQAASAAMAAAGQPSYEEFCAELEAQPKKLELKHLGRDSWSRPVYECDGRLYVDIDPRRSRHPKICTKIENAFDGEPDTPVADGVEISFTPRRDTWDF